MSERLMTENIRAKIRSEIEAILELVAQSEIIFDLTQQRATQLDDLLDNAPSIDDFAEMLTKAVDYIEGDRADFPTEEARRLLASVDKTEAGDE